jgi:hypothetical protein
MHGQEQKGNSPRKGIPWGTVFFSNKVVGAGFPKKKEGNSLFLGICGERGFRQDATHNTNTQQTPPPWWWSHQPLWWRGFDESMPPQGEGGLAHVLSEATIKGLR